MSESRFITLTAMVGILFAAAVYLPDLGRGFVKDDFRWLADARVVLSEPARVIRPDAPNFFRPLVTASFAADYTLFGIDPRAYGFTNFVLYLACIAGIWRLLRESGVGGPAACVGTFAWALNPHGINMALVWISGRTSLMLTLFAVSSAAAFLRGQRVMAAAALFAALLSKEEATVLPFVLGVWIVALRREDPRLRWRDAVALIAPLAAYFALRNSTSALTFASAPLFYRPTTDVHVLAGNVLEYVDRGGTIFLAIAAAARLVYGGAGVPATPRRQLAAGIAWFVGGYAITVWLPVRSSLYAVFPSVGSALLCAAVVDAMRVPDRERGHRDARLGAALASCLLLVPVYSHRNARWVEPARLSARVVQELTEQPPVAQTPGIVVFEDEPEPYATFDHALGSLATVAVRVVTNLPHEGRVTSREQPWMGDAVARYRVTHGRVDRIE
ncbi:MAG TPA: hypothetical protein VGY48_16590 [Vicinamibacterales bacterium]|nr:hypothetical protein [Vicinamibacterales bacterium]